MENEPTATNQRTKALARLMDAKSVAYLLAPCILFIWMAGYAVIYGTDYENMPQAREVLERQQKDAELRKIVAANIAAGDPIPDRETMLKELDVRDKRVEAWQGIVVDCAWSMRRMGVGVLLGIVAQVYVVFKLRAHIKKLVSNATAPPQNGTGL
jgi:hypothetical protein